MTIDDHAQPPEEMQRRIELTEGRPGLEALRDIFTKRLHRRSDDFDAPHGLRVVTAKLQRTSYGTPAATIQPRVRNSFPRSIITADSAAD